LSGRPTNRAIAWEREKSHWPNREASRFVDAGGLRWHVQQAGRGPVLLLVHGTGASTHTWRETLPLLAREYTVIAPDLPGHGFTGGLRASDYTIEGMGAALAALLRMLGMEPAYCVGHSAGAAILCRMALDRQIAPRRIIAINGAFLPFGGAAGVLLSPIAKLAAASPAFARVVSWRARDLEAVRRVIAGTGSKIDAAGLDLYARLVRDPEHVAGALGMMASWNLHKFQRELARLETPLTLIVGEADRAVPAAQADVVAHRAPRAEIVRVPGLGHLAHEEAPARVLAEVRAALARG
jgi:magnesium chelatase accessory protein